jgi:hypothetical protein
MRPSATRPLALLRAPLPRPSGRAWQRPAWRRAFAASAVSAPLLAVLLVPVQAEEPVPPFEGAGRAVARSDDALSTSVTSRLWHGFVQNVIEPLLTLKRFGHLVLIFLPVIITSPLLLAELLSREGARSKASTRFWYRLLVLQMERAGPTFIKVRRAICGLQRLKGWGSWLNGLDPAATYFRTSCAPCLADYTLTASLTRSSTPRRSSSVLLAGLSRTFSRPSKRSPWASAP